MTLLRRYFIAGLLVWVPLVITVWVVGLLVKWLDSSLTLLPAAYQPEQLLGFSVPGLGVALTLIVLLVTGIIVANFLGRRLVALWERILARIPLVRSIYSAAKQLAETMFTADSQSFRKVLLVEFPRRDMWTLAFLTGSAAAEAKQKTDRDLVNVYIPTTPNPTGGYFVMLPREDVQELDMSVDEGLRMLMSMGAVVPNAKKNQAKLAPTEAKS